VAAGAEDSIPIGTPAAVVEFGDTEIGRDVTIAEHERLSFGKSRIRFRRDDSGTHSFITLRMPFYKKWNVVYASVQKYDSS
jgi:hypothetical protein